MLTRCPKCNTLFRTSETDLRRAGGKTRCSQCYTVFLATEAEVETEQNSNDPASVMRSQAASALMQKLASKNQQQANDIKLDDIQPTVDKKTSGMGSAASSIYNELVIKNRNIKYDIPETLEDEIEVPPLTPGPPENRQSVPDLPPMDINYKGNHRIDELAQSADFNINPGFFDQPAKHPNLKTAPNRYGHEQQDSHFIPDILQDDMYDEIHIPSPKKNALLIGGILLVLLITLIQYIYYMRSDFADNPKIRPVIVKFCKLFNCDVPYKKDVSQFKMLTYTVEVHKNKKYKLNKVERNVGIVRAIFVNSAPFTQPFPTIEVKLHSLKQKNKPIGLIRLYPKNYLPRFVDIKKGLKPNDRVTLEFEYVIPTNESPSLQLDFK